MIRFKSHLVSIRLSVALPHVVQRANLGLCLDVQLMRFNLDIAATCRERVNMRPASKNGPVGEQEERDNLACASC